MMIERRAMSLLWGEEGQDPHTADSLNEAMEDLLDNCYDGSILAMEPFTMVAVRPMLVTPSDYALRHQLECIIETLDEEYGDPDAPDWTPTKEVTLAHDLFITQLCADYPVWLCAQASRLKVDPTDWCVDNNPDRLIDSMLEHDMEPVARFTWAWRGRMYHMVVRFVSLQAIQIVEANADADAYRFTTDQLEPWELKEMILLAKDHICVTGAQRKEARGG